jgi:hypothetical protein
VISFGLIASAAMFLRDTIRTGRVRIAGMRASSVEDGSADEIAARLARGRSWILIAVVAEMAIFALNAMSKIMKADPPGMRMEPIVLAVVGASIMGAFCVGLFRRFGVIRWVLVFKNVIIGVPSTLYSSWGTFYGSPRLREAATVALLVAMCHLISAVILSFVPTVHDYFAADGSDVNATPGAEQPAASVPVPHA